MDFDPGHFDPSRGQYDPSPQNGNTPVTRYELNYTLAPIRQTLSRIEQKVEADQPQKLKFKDWILVGGFVVSMGSLAALITSVAI